MSSQGLGEEEARAAKQLLRWSQKRAEREGEDKEEECRL